MFEKTVSKIRDFVGHEKSRRDCNRLVNFVEKRVGNRKKFKETAEFNIKNGRRYRVEIKELY